LPGFHANPWMNSFQQPSGYAQAQVFAGGLLFTLALVAPFLTLVNGSCLIYLQAIDGLNFEEAEETLRQRVEEAKRKAEEAKRRALEAAETAKARRESQQPPAPSAPAAPEPADAAAGPRTCINAQCKTALGAEDLFCGECGTRNPV